jgi:ABC-type multidrug transport system fused ATPase/permease subunit
LTHVTEGQILFDGVDIRYIPLQKLRKSLTIIPQDAVLLNGTIATNLDPTGQVAQVDLERTFDSCRNIASFHAHMDQREDEAGRANPQEARGHPSETLPTSGITLATPVNARGGNFSHGQRQVLSLCRALVRKSKLMLLDEATASMDYGTDQAIQTVLRQEIAQDLTGADGGDAGTRTLVTIAHRLRTIADYDKVVVMASGQVAEFGSPKELFEARGTFYDMVCHSGEREELEKLMSGERTQEADLLD